jgi:hypothetical protein
MQFVQPMPFEEAIDKLGGESPIGAALSSSEWGDLPVELRENAMFSAYVEDVRFLQGVKDSLGDFLAGNVKTLDDGQTLLATGSRAAFVDQMQRYLGAAGVARTDGGLQDITSERRLALIFDIKTQQAADYGYWRQGMNPAVLNEFPASRFIRVKDVKEPRLAHEQFQDQVYLKTDPIWARVINRDFGVPWGPWGWGCGHDVEDVDRDEAESLHLLAPGQKLVPQTKFFNQNLQASALNIEPDLLDKIKKVFGDKIVIEDGVIKWNAAAVERELAAAAPPVRANPVSDAIDVKVHGNLASQVDAALTAIDVVHDDGTLATLPLYETKQSAYGYVKLMSSADGFTANYLAIRPSGPWPALTTAHEVGHLLDLVAIGRPGDFASVRPEAAMAGVLAAAEKSDAIAGLRAQLAATTNAATANHLNYLLYPWEIFARAYAQFIAEKSASPLLQTQLQSALEAEKFRQWTKEDFAPVADAINKMFQQLGWL